MLVGKIETDGAGEIVAIIFGGGGEESFGIGEEVLIGEVGLRGAVDGGGDGDEFGFFAFLRGA